jgi:hypothetical protein
VAADIPILLVQRVARRTPGGSDTARPRSFQKPFVASLPRLRAAVEYLEQFDSYWAKWKLPEEYLHYPRAANGDVEIPVPTVYHEYEASEDKVGQVFFERWCALDVDIRRESAAPLRQWKEWKATSDHQGVSNWNALRRELATWAEEKHGDRFRNIRGWSTVNFGWIAAYLSDRFAICEDDVYTEYTTAQVMIGEEEGVVDGGGAQDDAEGGDAVAADDHLSAQLDALVRGAAGDGADSVDVPGAAGAEAPRGLQSAPLVSEPVRGKMLDEDTCDIFPNMFPKVYTNLAACFNSDRSQPIDFYDYVRHVSISTNGRAMRHPRCDLPGGGGAVLVL